MHKAGGITIVALTLRVRVLRHAERDAYDSDPAGCSRLSYLETPLEAAAAFTTTSAVIEATWRSFQSGKENVSLALPLAASSGTRTGA